MRARDKIEGLTLWGVITATLMYRSWPGWALPLLPSLWVNLPLVSLVIRREPLSDWGLSLPELRSTAVHVATFTLLLAPASLLILRWLGAIELVWDLDPASLIRSLGRELLWVALPEEIFFRGYLWHRLRQGDAPPPRQIRILANATLFTATHYLVQPSLWSLATWFPALYFTWIRCRTGNLATPILCHAVANTMLFAATGRL